MCVFCDIINGQIPSRKVYEDDNVLAIMDVSPLSKGHTIVMPKKHVASILEADEKTVDEVMNVTRKLAIHITDSLKADGCNILANCKEAAGQSVDHMHVHIIPRYKGDNVISLAENKEELNLDEIFAKIK